MSLPDLVLSIADNKQMLGLRYAEWATRAPSLEADIAAAAMGCPASEFILDDVRERLLREEGVSEVRIKVVWDPPWTAARMTQAGRDALEAWGLAV